MKKHSHLCISIALLFSGTIISRTATTSNANTVVTPSVVPPAPAGSVTQAQLLAQLNALLATASAGGATQDQINSINMMIASVTAITDPNTLATFVPMITNLQTSIQAQMQQAQQAKTMKPEQKSIIANLNTLLQTQGITAANQSAIQQLITQVQNATTIKELNQYNQQAFALANQISQQAGTGQNNAANIATIQSVLQGISTQGLSKADQQQVQMYNQQLSTINPADTTSVNNMLQQVIAFSNTIAQKMGTKAGQKVGLNELKAQVAQLAQLPNLNQTQQAQIQSLQSQVAAVKGSDTKNITALSNQAMQYLQQFTQQNTAGTIGTGILQNLKNQLTQMYRNMQNLQPVQQQQIMNLIQQTKMVNPADTQTINSLMNQTMMLQKSLQMQVGQASVLTNNVQVVSSMVDLQSKLNSAQQNNIQIVLFIAHQTSKDSSDNQFYTYGLQAIQALLQFLSQNNVLVLSIDTNQPDFYRQGSLNDIIQSLPNPGASVYGPSSKQANDWYQYWPCIGIARVSTFGSFSGITQIVGRPQLAQPDGHQLPQPQLQALIQKAVQTFMQQNGITNQNANQNRNINRDMNPQGQGQWRNNQGNQNLLYGNQNLNQNMMNNQQNMPNQNVNQQPYNQQPQYQQQNYNNQNNINQNNMNPFS